MNTKGDFTSDFRQKKNEQIYAIGNAMKQVENAHKTRQEWQIYVIGNVMKQVENAHETK